MDITKLIIAFRKFANTPKKACTVSQEHVNGTRTVLHVTLRNSANEFKNCKFCPASAFVCPVCI
jgi:hypothetical protein